MRDRKIKVACFGEVLWDIFPGDQKKIGGTPFNVAYHLFRMDVDASMISSVGNDEPGHDLLAKIKDWNIPTDHIQINDNHPTSTVIALIDESNDAHYDIVEDVAWDYIETTEADLSAISQMDALVFGTFATRNSQSRNTLFRLMEASHYNVLDISLREPYYDVKIIKEILHKTQLAKFNKADFS